MQKAFGRRSRATQLDISNCCTTLGRRVAPPDFNVKYGCNQKSKLWVEKAQSLTTERNCCVISFRFITSKYQQLWWWCQKTRQRKRSIQNFVHAARSKTLEFVPLAPFQGCLNFIICCFNQKRWDPLVWIFTGPVWVELKFASLRVRMKRLHGGGGGCVCEKHSLGRGRGLAAGCTGGLLWSGHSGRGLRGPDWGSANRMLLCWPHLGRTLTVS